MGEFIDGFWVGMDAYSYVLGVFFGFLFVPLVAVWLVWTVIRCWKSERLWDLINRLWGWLIRRGGESRR